MVAPRSSGTQPLTGGPGHPRSGGSDVSLSATWTVDVRPTTGGAAITLCARSRTQEQWDTARQPAVITTAASAPAACVRAVQSRAQPTRSFRPGQERGARATAAGLVDGRR